MLIPSGLAIKPEIDHSDSPELQFEFVARFGLLHHSGLPSVPHSLICLSFSHSLRDNSLVDVLIEFLKLEISFAAAPRDFPNHLFVTFPPALFIEAFITLITVRHLLFALKQPSELAIEFNNTVEASHLPLFISFFF